MIELLVAMAVFSLLIVLLMGMVDSATKLWRESENRVDAYREARAAMGTIERDLRNAVAANRTDFVRLNTNAFPSLQGADIQKDTNNAGAILFLSTQTGGAQRNNGNQSDLCETGYFLAYANSSVAPTGPKTMNLYRYFRSSNDTYSNLISSPTTLFQSITVNSAETDLLAKNIKAFRITPYHTDTNGACIAYNSSLYGAMPSLVEISITALNQDVSRKLDTASDWTNSSGPLSNAIKNVEQTFTTRVRLRDKL